MATWRALLAATMVGMITLLVGCGGTTACEETCNSDDDCETGLVCLDSSQYGKACLPALCETCFDRGQSCGWETETFDDGSSAECQNPICS